MIKLTKFTENLICPGLSALILFLEKIDFT